MPRRPNLRHSRRPPRDPISDFFDGIIDTVLDRVDETLTPLVEELSERVVQIVEKEVREAIPREGRPRGQRSSRQSQDSTHPHYPPPPHPHPPAEREWVLYNMLGVDRHAPQEVIAAAYRAVAKKYHPDVNKSSQAAEIMRAANHAYEVLSDPVKRAQYDRDGVG